MIARGSLFHMYAYLAKPPSGIGRFLKFWPGGWTLGEPNTGVLGMIYREEDFTRPIEMYRCKLRLLGCTNYIYWETKLRFREEIAHLKVYCAKVKGGSQHTTI